MEHLGVCGGIPPHKFFLDIPNISVCVKNTNFSKRYDDTDFF